MIKHYIIVSVSQGRLDEMKIQTVPPPLYEWESVKIGLGSQSLSTIQASEKLRPLSKFQTQPL